MIVGTAGHIDHGKTALVRAITGVDTDRLPEEKTRRISIDLGFAYKPLPNGELLGFVDMPGHVRFIGNMLAGAAGIDFVLLVIAADDGPMPQTHEHLAIMDLLGIDRGLVVLSKCDLVDADGRARALGEVRSLLADTRFAELHVMAVSSVTGEGLADLEARLASEAARPTRHRAAGNFRMAVDRCFVLPGAGTIVSGTVFAGRICLSDDVVVSPTGLAARVRAIHASNTPATIAVAGQRCALNLTGPEIAADRIRRGDWILAPFLHRPTERFDTKIWLLRSNERALRHWAPVHLHIGTANVAARVALLENSPILPGAEGYAQIVVERPIAALAGDRVILRDPAARQTVAGGIVLDPWPPNRGRRRPERMQILEALSAPSANAALCRLLALDHGIVEREPFARSHNLSADEIEQVTVRSTAGRLVTRAGAFLVSTSMWSKLREGVIEALKTHHAAAPDSAGLEMQRLRLVLAKRYPPDLTAAAVDALLSEGVVERAGTWLRLSGHSAHISAADQRIWDRVKPLIAETKFCPPRVRDLAKSLNLKEDAVRGLLRRLARIGLVVEVAHDHFYLRDAVAALADLAHRAASVADDGMLATNQYRDSIGTGRKVAIQVLEFFDRTGLTLRRGDARIVRHDRLPLFGLAKE